MLALGLVTLCCIGLLEALVRLFVPQPPSWLEIYRRHPRLPTWSNQPMVHAFIDTGDTRWTVFTDADGHRTCDPSQASSVNATQREVLWLGDSFTFAHGVDFRDSWIGQLATTPGSTRRHCNAGVGGHGPIQYRSILEDTLAQGRNPSTVVAVSYLGNDFHDTVSNKDIQVIDGVIGGEASIRAWLKRSLHSYRAISRLYHRIFRGDADPAVEDLCDPEQWRSGRLAKSEQIFAREFEHMASLCRAHDITFLAVVLPSKPMVTAWKAHGAPASIDTGDARSALARALLVLARLNIRFVDMTPVLAQGDPETLYFPFDGHFTREAHALVYEALRGVDELR